MAPLPAQATVLVVEDDPNLREMYRDALSVAGHAVVAVEDGIDALRQIEQAAPHLIVLDLMLPRLGGHDVQRELASRAETRDIPIVVVTGADTGKLRRTDFECILEKPVDADTLTEVVDRCLADVRRSPPATSRRAPISRRPPPTRRAGPMARRGPPRTVLVVDDDESVRLLLDHFLAEKGFQVVTAGGVGEGIAALEGGGVDAVVLDVRMPRRSGLELLEFIRLDPMLRDVPVMILTGATLTPDEQALIARDRGLVFYKSENLDVLAAHLSQLAV